MFTFGTIDIKNSHYIPTFDLVEINVADVAWHKLFCGKLRFVDKNGLEKKNKFGELPTKEIQEITDNAVPMTIKGHKIRNENS